MSITKQVTGIQGNRRNAAGQNEGVRGLAERAEQVQRQRRKTERLKRVRRQKFLTVVLALAAILCMALTCTMSYRSIRVQANSDFKYYTGVTVESGDNLWSIADRYIDFDHYADKEAYIAEIEKINHLDADEILIAGRLLVVPYYSAEYIE